MMSQASAISNPPPIATPFTAAISGLLRSKRWARPAKPLAGMAMEPPVAWFLRSLPAEKARSPAPVMMPTHCSGSALKALKASSISKCIGECTAFMTSGRLRVKTVTGPSRSTEMNS